MEILSGLSQRLQQLMRTLSLNYSDLSQLYQAEQQLTALGEVLQRLELKHLSQLDTLRTLMHNSAVRLENSHDASEPGVVIQHPAVATGTFNHAAPENPVTTKTDPVRWVYVAQPEPQSNIDVVAALPEPVKPRVFCGGHVHHAGGRRGRSMGLAAFQPARSAGAATSGNPCAITCNADACTARCGAAAPDVTRVLY